jgi:hypothetical protein
MSLSRLRTDTQGAAVSYQPCIQQLFATAPSSGGLTPSDLAYPPEQGPSQPLLLLLPNHSTSHVFVPCLAGGRGAGLDRDERYGERPERGVGPRDEVGFGPRYVFDPYSFM